ncbi:MAG: RND transporter [Proteobacteria bacterium SG_bin9]|nr:MAG: RND transporter [Proteobacteria bacterium SG_bin9]
MSGFRAALCAAIWVSLIPAGPVLAHEGHNHSDAPAAPAAAASAAPRGEVASEQFELVAVARDGELTVYLDHAASNEPIEAASVEAETPAGKAVLQAKPGEPYRLAAPWSAKPGSYDLVFNVTLNGEAEALPVTLVIPDKSANGTTGSRVPGGMSGWRELIVHNSSALLIAGLGGFVAGIALMLVLRRRAQAVAALLLVAGLAIGADRADAHEGHSHDAPAPASISAGRDLAQRLPDGSVFVPKNVQRILAIRTTKAESAAHRRAIELPGRIIPDPNANGYVQAAVGGRLSAPTGGFPRLGTPVKKGDVLAYVEPPLQAIDVSDMRQRQGELDQQISIVERRVARFETLAPSGAVSRAQLEEAQLELQGLRDRRSSLDRVRRQPEALTAPIDGIIAEGTPVAGQIAQSNAIIFHIIEPTRLWVEARSFDSLSGVHSATAKPGDGRAVPLSYQGAGFADRNQSIPVQFAITGSVAGLRAGQFVTVLATTTEEKTGVAIPRASLVRSSNGQDVIYEHVTAERFEPRAVRIEPLDGERVLVSSGLADGARIVVQGAELLGQVR